MKDVVSLVPYFGGASRMVDVMRYLMETAHQLGCNKLIETMAGSGVISINRDIRYFPSATLIEMDKGMGALLQVMADPELSLEFMKLVRRMIPSELLFIYHKNIAAHNYKVDDNDEGEDLPLIEIAATQYYLLCLSINAARERYSDRRIDFDDRLEVLWEVRKLLNGCTVFNDNCFHHIHEYIHDEKCLIVIDPPFIQGLRSSSGQYSYEWEDVMHELLLDVLTKETYTEIIADDELSTREILLNKKTKKEHIKDKPRAKVILFGFENELYTNMLTKAETPWYQFILEKPLLSSNKTIDGNKEIQRKSFWINFKPSEYAKSHVPELNKLRYLIPENLEENLEQDKKFKEDIIKKHGLRQKKREYCFDGKYIVKKPEQLRAFANHRRKSTYINDK